MVADAEGPALHGEVVFPIRNDAKAMKKSWLVWPQVWARLGNLLLHHLHISRLGTLLQKSEWTSKIHLWYQIKTRNIHKRNRVETPRILANFNKRRKFAHHLKNAAYSTFILIHWPGVWS